MFTFANPAAVRMTGYTPEQLTGGELHMLLDDLQPDARPGAAAGLDGRSLADDARAHIDREVVWRRKNGTCFSVEYTSTPIVDHEERTGTVVVFRDITGRRADEREKALFTSVVSHELRTPLTSIRGALGLLDSGALGALPQEGRRMVQIAIDNTDRLVRLINDLLDLERIDRPGACPRREHCDGAELISQAADAVMTIALAGDVAVTISAGTVRLDADGDRLVQTLTNLIANAVKFSPPGSTVLVGCERHNTEALFTVSDHGRGIPAGKLETIFERFEQVDPSDALEKSGTGLGLSICLTIVEQHGGRIWAHSTPGEGSTFTFAVPIAAGGGHVPQAPVAPDAREGQSAIVAPQTAIVAAQAA